MASSDVWISLLLVLCSVEWCASDLDEHAGEEPSGMDPPGLVRAFNNFGALDLEELERVTYDLEIGKRPVSESGLAPGASVSER